MPPGAASQVGSGAFERSSQINPAAAKRRHEAKEQAGTHRHRGREEQHAYIGREAQGNGIALELDDALEQSRAALSDQEAQQAAKPGEEQTLGEQLAD